MIRHTFQVLYSELKVSLVRLGRLTLARQVSCEGPKTDQLQWCRCNSSCSPYMSQIPLLWPEIPWPIYLTKGLGFKTEKNGCKNDIKCWTEYFTCSENCIWDFSCSNTLLKCSSLGSFSPEVFTTSPVDMAQRSLAAIALQKKLVVVNKHFFFCPCKSEGFFWTPLPYEKEYLLIRMYLRINIYP